MITVTTPARSQVTVLVDRQTRSLEKLDRRLEASADILRRTVAERFANRGDGDWPELAESTIADKQRRGALDPERQLYDTGALLDALAFKDGGASGMNGPQAFQILDSGVNGTSRIIVGVDWDRDGWQIPVLLDAGTSRMPARPIWPTGPALDDMKREIADRLRGEAV